MIKSERGLKRSIVVLLIEDSPGDVRLLQEAFRDSNESIFLHVAADGVEAMAFLKQEGGHALALRPDLILLDLNLPKMDGREVLAQIKQDDSLRLIPTVILTTSDAEIDILKSYQLHANGYLTKPVQLEAFEMLVKSIRDFWTKVKTPQIVSDELEAASMASDPTVTLQPDAGSKELFPIDSEESASEE
jgi:two-component system, chemotaxis family, response regulator Rcp1